MPPTPAVDRVLAFPAAHCEHRATPDADLADLVAGSFRLVEMAIELQDHYDVMFGQQDVAQLRTVGDLSALIHSRLDPPPT